MLAKLQYFFIPHYSNNQKAKALHLSSLTFLFVLISTFQIGLTLLTRIRPGILGFAANISPERLIELTNQRRIEQGLVPLQLNPLLVEAARQKAAEMFTFDCWSHNCNGRTPWWFFKNVGYNYLYAGENLAKDFGDSESVVTAWMNSPTHKDNILNSKYKEIGIAVVDGILNGEETTLVVQMFGTPAKAPAIAYAEQTSPQELEEKQSPLEEKLEKKPAEVMAAQPLISSFTLTKDFYLILLSFLIVILALDTVIISRNQIVRISGKSFVHLSFFIIILISILLTNEGVIL